MLLVFELTAFVFSGANERRAKFSTSVDWMAKSHESVERVFACVLDFVRDPSFTQKSWFSDSVTSVLGDAAVIAVSVIVSDETNPWSVFVDGCNQQIASELTSCQKKDVMRRKACRDTSGRSFGTQHASLLSTGATVGRRGVRVSNNLEEREVEYVALPEPAASSSNCVKSVVKKTPSSSAAKLPKRFEFDSPVTCRHKACVEDPSSSAALDREASGSRRRNGRDLCTAPLFQFGRKSIHPSNVNHRQPCFV